MMAKKDIEEEVYEVRMQVRKQLHLLDHYLQESNWD